MSLIISDNDAFMQIANVLVSHAEKSWMELRAECPILSEGCGGILTEQLLTGATEFVDVPIGLSVFEIDEACLYLRNNLLQKTGSRIWGLTFTLYPTGKFNIDYDYNKPEDYEESDEQITGAQANESLFKLGFRGESESNE